MSPAGTPKVLSFLAVVNTTSVPPCSTCVREWGGQGWGVGGLGRGGDRKGGGGGQMD